MRPCLLLLPALLGLSGCCCTSFLPPPDAAVEPTPPAEPTEELAGKGTEMSVHGEIVELAGDAVVGRTALPEAIHEHGEAMRGLWVAPDGTGFAVGYMYTGVPGPDTGVVYRRVPGGAWEIVYSKRENELGHVWGRNARDVYAAGVTTLAHYDGTAWSEVPVPGLEGNLSGIWGTDTDLWVCGGSSLADTDAGRIYHCDAAGKWTVEAKAGAFLYDMGGVGTSVWAVGDEGIILHRGPDGTWVTESTPKRMQHTRVWASGPDDVWVAGSRLLHSTGDGTWTEVSLPVHAQVTEVWGRAKGDVYAGTMGGLFHLQGGSWKETGYTGAAEGLGGTDTRVFVANENMGG
jgi:hypothetical protein